MMEENAITLSNPLILYALRQGNGDIPLLLIHGFPFDHTIWSKQITALGDTYQVVAPDLRGHGRSLAPNGPYSVDLMAQDIIATLDALEIEKAVWVGHSIGGYITLAGWRLAPERFAGMGLIATQQLADSIEARQKRYDLIERIKKEGAEAAVNTKLFTPDTPEDTQYYQDAMEIMRLTPVEGLIGALHAMATRPDSTDTLKTIDVPALVLAGKEDQLIPAERAAQMAALLPDEDWVMVDGAGHMPMLEQVPQTTQALNRLMQRSLAAITTTE